MKKYADVPKQNVEVVPPKETQQIQQNLHRLGKKSASELTPDERKDALNIRK
jgi:hypothetical protein